MKLNGMVMLLMVVALAVFTSLAWSEGEDTVICPRTGEPVTCTGDGPHGPRGDHRMGGMHHNPARMAEVLDLSEAQQEAVRELLEAGRETMRERMDTAMAGILTPEQLVKFDELKARREVRGEGERPGRMGHRGKRGVHSGDRGDMPARRLELMTEHLDLTPEQQDEIRTILEEATPPPRAETREKILAVLTPEQQEKMGQHREQCPSVGQREGKGRMHGRPGRDGDMHRRLARQLDLTDEQQTTVRATMSELRSEHREEMRSRLEALLTPEQREKLEQIHQNRPLSDR